MSERAEPGPSPGLDRARRLRRSIAFLFALRALPARVAVFQWRARRAALRSGDEFSVVSATRPAKLSLLLELARGRRRVVELGTATGWTALSLLLADQQRTVTSYDLEAREHRERYVRLAGRRARARVRFVCAPGSHGPISSEPVELLYIDSSHACQETVQEVRVWQGTLAPDALIVFDDFDHPDYPGVREAVLQLELQGEARDGLFIHRFPARADSSSS